MNIINNKYEINIDNPINSNYNINDFIDYVNIEENEITNISKEISISTMCASCKLNTKINIDNIEHYLDLNSNDILTVKVSKENMRSLITVKNKSKRVKLKESKNIERNYFYNQITVVIRVTHGHTEDINLEPKINMKLFKNGSIQMSGCKSVNNINIVLNKLINRLIEVKAKICNGIILEKLFIDDINNITVKSFKIDMINTNYQINMRIDREKLYILLLKKKIKSTYEPCIRACVIIKYVPKEHNIEEKEISIFIFQKGNIIITGARSKHHIMLSYNYINKILLIHKDDIIKKYEIDEEKVTFAIYKDILNDINNGIIIP